MKRDLPMDMVQALRARHADRLRYVGKQEPTGDSDHEQLGAA